MAGSSSRGNTPIDKRDFDAHRFDVHRPLLREVDSENGRLSPAESRFSRTPLTNDNGDDSDGLLHNVVEEIVERDRRKMHKEVVRVVSFAWGVISCLGAGSITAFSLYGPLLLTRLHYTQLRVNGVSIAAEIAMYLPVSLFGFLCDRYSPSPLSLLSAFLFGGGYLLAALTYRSGPPADAGGTGWPFWVMIVAFILVGAGTSCLYLAAVATCAKNFGRGQYKGIMLSVPIAAFGLSGMWQSQVGTYLLYEGLEDGSRGDVDVFRYFLFLAILLFAIGLVGTVGLRIVDDDEKYIDEAVDELERSGIVDESDFFRSRSEVRAAYGTFAHSGDDASSVASEGQSLMMSDEEREARRIKEEKEEEERRKKNWLLNYETRLFLKDQTMWWLALGFFLVTGPGEAYINNLGTIIQTLTPRSHPPSAPPPAGLPSTHVTTVALTSTIARILTGSLSDLFAPPALHFYSISQTDLSQTNRFTLSRLTFLLPSALLLSVGYLLLATPVTQNHPQLFHVTTAFVGVGYGSAFSLVPILISAVWGVENFGTNWGIVAMFPAFGAAVWGLIYSRGYQDATVPGETQCHGWECYGFWAVGCTISVWVAIVGWMFAWRGWKRRGVVV